jgi:hypothetical protein
VVGATCSNGVFAATTAAVPAAGPVELGIRRTATDVVFEHRSPGAAWRPVASLPRAGLSPAFAAPARPYLYFGNPASGTTEARVDELHVTGEAAWDDPRDRFSFDPAWDILATVDLVYGTELDRPLALTLRTINTSALEIPSDLQDVPFDDARMKARYRAFVDHVFSRIPAVELLSVSVGNEIDGWLGAASGRWAQYASFAADAIPHARAAWTHGPILVGATATTGGLRGRPADLAAVNATADVAMLTYYPLRGDFTVEDPSVVAADFTSFVALTNLPLFFAEAGYPSAGPSPA